MLGAAGIHVHNNGDEENEKLSIQIIVDDIKCIYIAMEIQSVRPDRRLVAVF